MIVILSVTGFYIGHPFMTVAGEARRSFVMGWMKVIHGYTAYAFITAVLARVIWMFTGNRYARVDKLLPVYRARWRGMMPTVLLSSSGWPSKTRWRGCAWRIDSARLRQRCTALRWSLHRPVDSSHRDVVAARLHVAPRVQFAADVAHREDRDYGVDLLRVEMGAETRTRSRAVPLVASW